MALYYLGNARTDAQAARMRQLEDDEICLFCPPCVDQEAADGLDVRTTHWVVRHNDFRYRGARLHLLVIPRHHVTDLVDLPTEALGEFWDVVRDIRSRHDLTFYGLGARCGDCAFTGGTIAHVHVHLVVGEVSDPEHQPVRLKLSSRPQTG